ncbi:MAG: hypothetical protein WCL39_12165 [Armatimonadota bacterium]|jgi:predicted RNase H-like HicB family nuclease
MTHISQGVSQGTVRLDVLVYKEGTTYIAHCLQTNIVAQGETRDTAFDEIMRLTECHLAFAIENDNMDHFFCPAPTEDWRMLLEA